HAHSLPSMPFQLGSIGIILNQTEASGFSLIEYSALVVISFCCMFWICFEFYALLFGFISYFVLRISYFLSRACLILAMPV
ncbi:MAG: hypothetical protein NUV76_07445, partial [Candidatus Kuenenia sp.]|nr:hypothetical protein [Candidatus Kuenenia sp.]